MEAGWRNYGLTQPRGVLPTGPLVVIVHMASVWVPFTSESKEAIADYDEIRKEMKLALQDCGRKLGTYLRRRKRMRREAERRSVFERYIGEIARNCNAITGADAEELYGALMKQARRKTEEADQMLDDEGRLVDDGGRLARDEDVIILDGVGGDEFASPAAEPRRTRVAVFAGEADDAGDGDSDRDGSGAPSGGDSEAVGLFGQPLEEDGDDAGAAPSKPRRKTTRKVKVKVKRKKTRRSSGGGAA